MPVGRRILQSNKLVWHQWCVRRETRIRQGKSVILVVTWPRDRDHIWRTKGHICLKFPERVETGLKDSCTNFRFQPWEIWRAEKKNHGRREWQPPPPPPYVRARVKVWIQTRFSKSFDDSHYIMLFRYINPRPGGGLSHLRYCVWGRYVPI